MKSIKYFISTITSYWKITFAQNLTLKIITTFWNNSFKMVISCFRDDKYILI